MLYTITITYYMTVSKNFLNFTKQYYVFETDGIPLPQNESLRNQPASSLFSAHD